MKAEGKQGRRKYLRYGKATYLSTPLASRLQAPAAHAQPAALPQRLPRPPAMLPAGPGAGWLRDGAHDNLETYPHRSEKTTMSNSPDNNDVVILAAARTPQGRLNGQLSSFTAVELGTHAIRAALAASGVGPDQVDSVIMGQVLQAGAGQNPARQSAIGAGIGWNVPAVSINKVCLSGLTAVIDAARMIRSGDAAVVVA